MIVFPITKELIAESSTFLQSRKWRTGELNPCSSGLWAQRDYRDTRPRYTFTIAFLARSKLLKASFEDRIRTYIISFKGGVLPLDDFEAAALSREAMIASQGESKPLADVAGKEQGWT